MPLPALSPARANLCTTASANNFLSLPLLFVLHPQQVMALALNLVCSSGFIMAVKYLAKDQPEINGSEPSPKALPSVEETEDESPRSSTDDEDRRSGAAENGERGVGFASSPSRVSLLADAGTDEHREGEVVGGGPGNLPPV